MRLWRRPRRTSTRGRRAAPYTLRSRAEFSAFFDGLELVEPGVVSVPLWRPDPDPFGSPAEVDALCGVARKP